MTQAIDTMVLVVAECINSSMIEACVSDDVGGVGREPLLVEEFMVVGEGHMLSTQVDELIEGMGEAIDRLHERADQREAMHNIPAFRLLCLDE